VQQKDHEYHHERAKCINECRNRTGGEVQTMWKRCLLFSVVIPSISAFTTRTKCTVPKSQLFAVIDEFAPNNDDDDGFNLEAFQARKQQQEEEAKQTQTEQLNEEFDGYAFRDVIYEKWGLCYDVDFNRVDAFGIRKMYLNILPFHLGGRRFRHETELDYLCHLQAVVEILQKYEQVCRNCFRVKQHLYVLILKMANNTISYTS
jgi:hypothetical protein